MGGFNSNISYGLDCLLISPNRARNKFSAHIQNFDQ